MPFFCNGLTSETLRFAQRCLISSGQDGASMLPQLPETTGGPYHPCQEDNAKQLTRAFLSQRSHVCRARSVQRRSISSNQNGAPPLRCIPSQARVCCGKRGGWPAGVGRGGLATTRGRGDTGHSVPSPRTHVSKNPGRSRGTSRRPRASWNSRAPQSRVSHWSEVFARSRGKLGLSGFRTRPASRRRRSRRPANLRWSCRNS